jgi:hypothetical protein
VRPELSTDGPRGRAQWLMDELGNYLVGSDAPATSRDDAARAALRNGHRGFRAFVDSRCEPSDVVMVELSIERASGHVCQAAYREVPGPLDLLVLCTTNCVDGDKVTLRHMTAQRGSVTCSEDWPFGMDSAERMTRPAAAWMTCPIQGREESADGAGGA